MNDYDWKGRDMKRREFLRNAEAATGAVLAGRLAQSNCAVAQTDNRTLPEIRNVVVFFVDQPTSGLYRVLW